MAELSILCDGPAIFSAMLLAIDQARIEVALDIYMFKSDQTGKNVLEHLRAAAKRGCRVRVLYDDVGSMWTPRNFFDPLREVGGEVVAYHPISFWKPNWNWFRRNHRKMLLIDHDIAFIGGVNIGDEYRAAPEDGGYHDLAARLEGPVCEEAWNLFERTWLYSGTAPVVQKVLKTAIGSLQVFRFSRRPAWKGRIRVVGKFHLRNRWKLRREMMNAIRSAQRSVQIMNPYFLPDPGVLSALIEAQARGVCVDVIVPRETDVTIVDLASRIAQQRLIRKGIRIWLWPGMAHGKVILIDEEWLSIGSYNFDDVSLHQNLEVVMMTRDASQGKILADIFEQDRASASQRSLEDWATLPVWKRAVSRLAYRFRRVL